MNDVKNILQRIMAIDDHALAAFYDNNQICFNPDKPDWLYPKLCNFFKDREHNIEVDTLLSRLGETLNKQYSQHPLCEITAINKSLCIDDSFVESFIEEMQQYASKDYRFQELRSPYKTKSIFLPIKELPRNTVYDLAYRYGNYEHPYILAELAECYILSGEFIASFPYLYKSVKQVSSYPNKYWNSEYALIGIANTFRQLATMSKNINTPTYFKITKLLFMYLTRITHVIKDKLAQQTAYVNRAAIALDSMTSYIMPLGFNPKLLYISDMYYAHYCNDKAEHISTVSGMKYNMKSLTYYQNASLWSNDTGGYMDIEDDTYSQIVQKMHNQADIIAYDFFQELKSGKITIENKEMNNLFRSLENECRYNYLQFKNRVSQFKK